MKTVFMNDTLGPQVVKSQRPASKPERMLPMYQFFLLKGLVASTSDLPLITQILGRTPLRAAFSTPGYAPIFQPEIFTA
ncbi:MAG: hypothetical protein ACO1OF_02535 [Adhaeribacter sp.]